MGLYVPLLEFNQICDRSCENQCYRASGLNLVVLAITLWNTVYLEKAIEALRHHESVDETLLPPVSALPREHVNLTGDYIWHANKRAVTEDLGRYGLLNFHSHVHVLTCVNSVS